MISRTFASKDHADEVSQALNFGCPILGGMLIFYLAEKIMAAFSQDSHGHCSTHGHVRSLECQFRPRAACRLVSHVQAQPADEWYCLKLQGHVRHVHTDSCAGETGGKSATCAADADQKSGDGNSMLDVPPERTISGIRRHISRIENSKLADICRRCPSARTHAFACVVRADTHAYIMHTIPTALTIKARQYLLQVPVPSGSHDRNASGPLGQVLAVSISLRAIGVHADQTRSLSQLACRPSS